MSCGTGNWFGSNPAKSCTRNGEAAKTMLRMKQRAAITDPWELDVIIINASVKWELTAWPNMDMANVAVTSTLVAGRLAW